MNLRSIVNGYTQAINPNTTATIKVSIGSTTASDGSRIPSYAEPVTVQVQRQALAYNDIAQLDGLNIQGVRCKLYINGNWNGLVRASQKGGDIITLADGTVWLVAMVLEDWSEQSGWTALACTLQDNR